MTKLIIPNIRVPLGDIVTTRNAWETLDRADALAALAPHAIGDWGDVCPADRESNELALREGSRLRSHHQ